MEQRADLRWRRETAETQHRGDAKPQGQAVECDDPADFAGTQAPGGVEAVANGTAAQQRQTHGVAEGVADEAGQGSLPQRQRLADVAQGQGIVEGQHRVAEGAGEHGQSQPVDRDCLYGRRDVREGPGGKLTVNCPCRRQEQQQRDGGQDKAAPRALGRIAGGRQLGLRRRADAAMWQLPAIPTGRILWCSWVADATSRSYRFKPALRARCRVVSWKQGLGRCRALWLS